MSPNVLPQTVTSTRHFLQLLIRRQLLKPGFLQILGGKYLDEVDAYLLDHHLIDDQTLAQVYAEFYGLPLVELVDRPILPEVARLLPEDVALKHTILVYELSGTVLRVVIGDPTRLQRNAPEVLVRLRKQKGVHIDLAIAPRIEVMAAIRKVYAPSEPSAAPIVAGPPADRKAAIADRPPVASSSIEQKKPDEHTTNTGISHASAISGRATQPSSAPKQFVNPTKAVVVGVDEATHPAEHDDEPRRAPATKGLVKTLESRIRTIDLTTITIPSQTLTRIPRNVAEKYQIIVFGEESPKSKFEPPLIKVAAVNPDDIKVREILSFIEQKNKVLVDRYQTSLASFEAALNRFPPPTPSQVQIVSEQDERTPATTPPVGTTTAAQSPKPPPISTPTTDPTTDDRPVNLTASPVTAPVSSPPPPAPVASAPSPDDVSAIQLTADDIMARPSEESGEELQRLAKEQELNLENQNLDRLLKEPITTADSLAKVFKGGRIPEIVAATLFLAIRMKASDVHVEAEQEMVRVRFRVDGILHDVIRAPHFLHAPLISRIKILSKMKIDEQRVPQDGRFDVVIDSRQVDLRVSTLPTVHGEKIVMRLLDKSEGVLTLEQLGVTGTNFDRLIENINKPYGIILSTGPTGSGKSTTLYAVLTRISKPGVNIITLEDPVEYELPGINQAQVKPGIGFTFAEGLRSVLRQDPNVIMVGEVRDLETAAMATHAALTGHLVLSTLHTNDAAGALPRLINMGVEPFLITSSVNAVVGQRLVRKICDNCKRKAEIPPAVLRHVKKDLETLPTGKLKGIDQESLVFYKGEGCPQCTDGYRGRIGIYEVLTMSEKIEALAVAKAPASEIKKVAIEAGMITMSQDGLIKALKGITTIDEVLRVTTTQMKELPV